MQGCETRARADSPQAAEQGYTQLWREMPASSNLVIGKRERFREVHRFSVDVICEQDRAGWFESGGVKLVLAGRQPAAGATAALLCWPGKVHPAAQLQLGIGEIGLLECRRACCPEGERQTDFSVFYLTVAERDESVIIYCHLLDRQEWQLLTVILTSHNIFHPLKFKRPRDLQRQCNQFDAIRRVTPQAGINQWKFSCSL